MTHYKHKYGGIYRYITDALNKENNQEFVVYEHVYPFPKSIYCRNKNEFYASNTLLNEDQLQFELSKPREEFQNEITNSKSNK